MNPEHPDAGRLRLWPRLRDGSGEPAPPPPLRHHPVIAISVVLIIASAVQIGVWVVSQRFPAAVSVQVSPAIVHGALLDEVAERVCATWEQNGRAPQVAWAVLLAFGWLSGPVWYLAVRAALGPSWALAAALGWVAHPAYAFLAQRATPLALLMVLVPLLWLLLLRWKIRQNWHAALALGVAGGFLTSTSLLGLLFLPVVMVSVLTAGRRLRTAGSAVLVLSGWMLVTGAWWIGLHDQRERNELSQRIVLRVWDELEQAEPRGLAGPAGEWRASRPAEHRLSPLAFLGSRWWEAPAATLHWTANRAWRTLYSTAEAVLQRPLFATQLIWLGPAVWGLIVALRYRPWRYAAATAGCLAGGIWTVAAVAEPLARNVTPLLGFGIVFALIGLADVYERLFGRSLTGDPDAPETKRLATQPDRGRLRIGSHDQ